VSGPPTRGVAYRGCNHEAYEGGGHDCPIGTVWVDVWGTEWHKELEGVMAFPRKHPIPEPSALKGYAWPDPNDERVAGKVHDDAKAGELGDAFLAGSHRETLWEKTYMLVGMERAMVYFYTEPEFMREVMGRIMDFDLAIAQHYLDVGVELALLGDDLGTQAGPLLGPQIVEEFLVPEYRRLFDFYRARGVLISFHSCGNIEWMLDTFMDLGVDVLNPVQATANDLARVRAKTRGRMALQGGISTGLIMNGPVEAIDAEVRHRIPELGRDGGYFCRQDQGMPFPAAHREALARAVEAYGTYPLDS
jgi:uroporphyrinogen decarboxylase